MGLFNLFLKKEEKEPITKTVNKIIIQESARGTSGTEIFAGYYDEEYLETLQGTDRADCFDKMRRGDSQAKMLLSAVKNPIRTASREINAASDDPEHQKHAELCRQVMFRDIKFNKFLNESLTTVDFGHSVFEKVHKVNIDKQITDEDGNIVLTSYIGLKKLGWRSPKTIETWNFNDEKEFVSITQQADGDLASYEDIPKEHLVMMAIDQEGDDLEGISMLRPCFGNYFRKNTYLKLNAIGIEKSMPIPTAEVPVGHENSDQFDNLIKSLESFTSHQQMYLTFPTGWNVELNNGTAYDPSKVEQSIDNEDKRMAKAFLANFLELGLSGGGAFALSNDLSDFFLSGLLYISNIIKEEIDDILKELVILNFGEQDKYPTFEFTGIKDKAGEEFARILDLLIKGKVIVPDDNLEDHVRKRIGITARSDKGKREIATQEPMGAPMEFSEKDKYKVLQEDNGHIHIDSNGDRTGPAVFIEGGHYHLLITGQRTSVDKDTPNHTHKEPKGGVTSPPRKEEARKELSLSEKIQFAINEKRKLLGDE